MHYSRITAPLLNEMKNIVGADQVLTTREQLEKYAHD